MVSLVDEEKWAPLIGRFFLSFGSIESVTHDCIRIWSGKIIHKHIKNMPLSRRIDLAIDLIAEQSYSDTNKAIFIKDFQQAKILVEQRNLIAHSPLMLVLFQDEPNTPFHEAIVSNTKDGHFVKFEELQEALSLAKTVAERIHHNMAAFRLEGINLNAIPSEWKGLPGSSA